MTPPRRKVVPGVPAVAVAGPGAPVGGSGGW